MSKTRKITIKGSDITLVNHNSDDYISLTDMVKSLDSGNAVIENWLRNKNTIEFLSVWEQLNNPNFNSLEFEGIKKEAGLNRFHLSAKKWIQVTNGIGLIAKAGRYGGTYAHKDIAFEFGSWISPSFKLYLIKEYQRLKEVENNQYNLEWNVAVFGYTKQDWKTANPTLALKNKNPRDYASINELLVITRLETLNSDMIKNGKSKSERFEYLKKEAGEMLTKLNEENFIKSIQRKTDTTYVETETPPEIKT